ncbi:MAG: DUF2231 domain-containing protein [Thermoanaerobaculia bacterium]
MKSKAALGNHPIHPMLVPIPIGAFFIALVGDVLFTVSPEEPFWYELSFTCIAIGIAFALLAAVFGAVDYFSVRMSSRAFRIATWHAAINLMVIAFYTASCFLRRHGAAMPETRRPLAVGLAVIGFGLLGISGWLGGKLAFEHRVGVVERTAEAAGRPVPERAAS